MVFGLAISILLLVVRFPAAALVSRMSNVGESKVISVFYARGLAAAVLAFLPAQLGFAASDFYLQSIAAIIVFSNVILTIGYPLTTSGIRRRKPKYEEEPKIIKDEEERPYGF
jgi:hypothetical protein